MVFRKICNDTSTMSATELAHNFVFVKNREAWYRDFDREIPVRDLMREICAKHAAPADADELTDEELDEILYDNLQFGTDDLEGVFALLYMALFGMADVRAWLERYETTGLPTTNRPEVLQECVNTYGAEAQVDMAVEEMSELTKALLKYRRKEAQGSKDLEAARENILEEVADVIIMLTQLDLRRQRPCEGDHRKQSRPTDKEACECRGRNRLGSIAGGIAASDIKEV